MLGVVEREGPKTTHRWRLILLEGYGVFVCAVETLTAGIEIPIDISRRARRVVIHVGLGARGPREIVKPPGRTIRRRIPPVADGTTVIVKIEQRRNQLFLRRNSCSHERIFDLGIFVRSV